VNVSYPKLFSETLQKHSPLSDTLSRKVYEHCTIKTFLKNEIIAHPDKTDAFEYFLLSGILHLYSFSSDNEEVTTRIFLPLSVVTPHIVRTKEGKSIQSLACLQEAVAAVIPMQNFNTLMRENAELSAFGHKVIENELVFKTLREISLLTDTAKERLLQFRKDYPNVENIIPHKIISGFLGITPVSFSRLRNELANSKS